MKADYDSFRKPDYKFRARAMYAEGYTLTQIAEELELSYTTVHRYIVTWNNSRWGISKEDLLSALEDY